jgi:hypothetical protein
MMKRAVDTIYYFWQADGRSHYFLIFLTYLARQLLELTMAVEQNPDCRELSPNKHQIPSPPRNESGLNARPVEVA